MTAASLCKDEIPDTDGTRLLTDLDLIPDYLQVVEDQSETSAFVTGIGRQLALVRNFIRDGIPAKLPKGAWFRRDANSSWSTVFKHRGRLMFNGNAYRIKGDFANLEQVYVLIRSHVAAYAWESYLYHLAGGVIVEEHDDEYYRNQDWFFGLDKYLVDPFLADWPGSRLHALNEIANALPFFRRLIEPFGATGAIGQSLAPFAICDGRPRRYLCADVDKDIVAMLTAAAAVGDDFENQARAYFAESEAMYAECLDGFLVEILRCKDFIAPDEYLGAESRALKVAFENARELRDREEPRSDRRNILTFWLQRCVRGHFLSPDAARRKKADPGRLESFPDIEFKWFREVRDQLQFIHTDFRTVMNVTASPAKLLDGDVFYCNPPFADCDGDEILLKGRTPRYAERFTAADQGDLASLARDCADHGYPVLISNSDNDFTRNLYARYGAAEIIGGIPIPQSDNAELLALWVPPKKKPVRKSRKS